MMHQKHIPKKKIVTSIETLIMFKSSINTNTDWRTKKVSISFDFYCKSKYQIDNLKTNQLHKQKT